ncbi:hypothetical protein AKO1_008053 [Acrasis kona]|uniref:Uncharacterized protein n=1 Tax=Acrasis kona TaxID=1008807 RepID=A0AAW2YPD2_9EUKA
MFDCGEGTTRQLIICNNVSPRNLRHIFITHLHSDHYFGVPNMLYFLSSQDCDFDKTIHLYGPLGIKKYIRNALGSTHNSQKMMANLIIKELVGPRTSKEHVQSYMKHLPRKLPFENSKDNIKDLIYRDESMSCYNVTTIGNNVIQAAEIDHLRAFCVGYVIKEEDRRGAINAELLQSKYNLKPGKEYGLLKSGQDIVLDDANKTIIRSSEVCEPTVEGKKLVILGDTSNPYNISGIARNCDMLVHESTFEDEMKDECISRGHSTPTMAARFARDVNAKKLIITHFSNRYKDTQKLLGQARRTFNNTEAANDFDLFDV